MGGQLQFIKAALKNPLMISTVFQTSPWLTARLVAKLNLESSKLVFELGPGAGAITQFLANTLSHETKYIGIELNEDLTAYLTKQYPSLEFRSGSAEQCAQIADEVGLADAVISSLPWTMFPPELQKSLITSIAASLRLGGQFATYVCITTSGLPSAKNLKDLLDKNFSKVEKSRTEYRNIPPAFVYTCTK